MNTEILASHLAAIDSFNELWMKMMQTINGDEKKACFWTNI